MSSSKAIQGQSSPEVQAFINNIFDQYRNADTTLAEKLAVLNLSNRQRLEEHSHEPKTEKAVETHARLSGFNSVVTFDGSDGQVHVPVPFHHAEDWSPSRIKKHLENSAPWQVQLDAPFKCSLCRKIVTLRGQEAWMIHVYADLKAYVCLHPQCSDSFEYYHLWAEHMLAEHFSKLKRYCVYCNAEIVSNEDISTRNAFVQHLVYNHWDNLSDAERTAATLNTEKFVLATFNEFPCGICKRRNWKTWYDFAAHVARHLEEISLAALYHNPYLLKDNPGTRVGKSKGHRLQNIPGEQGEPTKSRRNVERIKPQKEKASESDESDEENPDYVNVDIEPLDTPLPTIKRPHQGSLRPRKVPDNGTGKLREKRGEKSQSVEVPGHGKLVITGDNEVPVRVKFKDKDRRRSHRKRDDSQPNKQKYPEEDVEQTPSITSPYPHYLPYHFQYDRQNLGQGYENYRYAGPVSTQNYYVNNYPHFRGGMYDTRFPYQNPMSEEHSLSAPVTHCGCPTCTMTEDYAR